MTALRLVTSNLLNGRSITDGTVNVERMVASLAALRPTVLAMQEVDRFQNRSGCVDHTAEIAAAMPNAQWRFVPAIVGEPGANWRPATPDDPASGHDLAQVDPACSAFGTALVTTLNVLRWQVVRLPPFPRRAPVFIPGGGGLLMIDDEPRVCLAAVVEYRGRPITVAAAHTSFVPGWNVRHLRRIGHALRGLPAPRFLLGDLNLPSQFPSRILRWQQLATGLPTFPAPSPVMQLDHVLLDDPGARFGGASGPSGAWRAQAHLLDFSDHRALSVEYVAHHQPAL